jgi:hypothetical protein
MHPVRLLAPAHALVGLVALALANCELVVQLDRSAADAGQDAGCPICGDAGPGDAAGGDARSSLDASADGTAIDATSVFDATDGGGG